MTPHHTPLNVIDEQLLPWDRSQPLSFVCEMRVSGRFDPERLEDAARVATSSHPMARARLKAAPRPYASPAWEIMDRIDALPMSVVDCASEAMFERERSRLRGRRIHLDHAPPFAILLARRADGDSLCMSFSHVVMDGLSAYRLMRSIALAYAGINDVANGPDPISVHDLAFYTRAQANHRKRGARLRYGRSGAGDSAEVRSGVPVVTHPHDAQTDEADIADFHVMQLSPEETASVLERRVAPATLNDLLIASVAVAVRRWDEARNIPSRPLAIQMPLNLRPRDWAVEVVGNLVANVNVPISEREQTDLVTAQLAIAAHTRAAKQRRDAGTLNLKSLLNDVPTLLRDPTVRLMRRRASYSTTIAMSNLGAIEFPDLGSDAGEVTAFWLGPCRGSPGGTIATALTLRGAMFLAVHRKAVLDRAQLFGETWRDVLLKSE